MSADVAPGPVRGAGPVVGARPDTLEIIAERPAVVRHPLPWGLVGVLSLGLAAADMFHVISIQGAVGSIERNQDAFYLWLRLVAIALPFFVAGVVLALRTAHRRMGAQLRTVRTVAAAGTLIVLVTTLVGLGGAAANAAVDYRLQAAAAEKVAQTMHHGTTPGLDTGTGRNSASCTGACKRKADTRAAHLKGLALLTPVMLGTNLVVVAWIVALAGGSLDPRRRRTA